MFGFGNFDPVRFVGLMLGFIVGTALHEFMHAYSALRLGDTTAEREGRVTLNPVAHFDPVGFFMCIMLALGVPALAWGRPVPVNPYALRFGRRGMSIVAAAGPLSNLALAAVLIVPFKFIPSLPPDVDSVLYYMILINLLLFSFNLIPIPPLDGFNILSGVLPNYWTLVLEPIRQYGVPILIGSVLLIPYLSNIIGQSVHGFDLNPIWQPLQPVIGLLSNVFFGTG